jgi:ubiquinone/menaquinone biosynthesis C-methylase UbiE
VTTAYAAPSGQTAPFDALAEKYDAAFTDTPIGRAMRAAIWSRLDARFHAGHRILELNCGTGEDAVHLAKRGVRVLATDISPAMVAATRRKALAQRLEHLVETREMAIEEAAALVGARPFDGVLSDFGGLNCVADLETLAETMARLVRPGGAAMFCVMGPVVPWEWCWYLLHGRPRKAFRRLRPGGVPWQGITVRYPSIGRLRRAFSPYFRLERASAVGALTPPPYGASWAARHPRLFASLDRWERRLESVWPLPLLGDHYLVELIRCEREVSEEGRP